MTGNVTADSIRAAYEGIRPHIVNHPLLHSRTFSAMSGCTALFKLENLQMTGSFKERGALNRLLELGPAERDCGVICASAGNHAQAVAYHAQRLGISAKIVMPKYSPLVKIRSTEHWGADVILEGENFDEAYAYSQQLAREEKRTYLHPFDDERVIEGQGTIGLEILESAQGPDIDTVLVPIGGGGLIAGVATYIKETRPEVRVVGVEETNCNGMSQSRLQGSVVELPPAPIIADGIGVRKVSARNLDTVARYVDDIVTVSSDEIANAIMLMLEIEKVVIEGAAAVTLAALINQRVPGIAGQTVVSVISGGNIDVNLLSRIINRGLTFDGRVTKVDTVIMDKPGALERLLGTFRESGANVLEVAHHRFSGDAPIGQISVSITAETRNPEHIEELRALLESRGYEMRR